MSSSLDIENHAELLTYLKASGKLGPDEPAQCETLAGGVSSRTVLVRRPSGEAWVLKQALAKLRVEMDWFSDPLRVHREALGLRWLEQLTPRGSVPPLVFEDFDEHLFAMQAVPEPHENWKTMLLAGRLDVEHVRQMAQLLAALHGQSWLRRDEVAPLFNDRSYYESLRIEPYYQCTANLVPAARTALLELVERTRSRRYTLVHGDFSPKNVLIHAGHLVLLDHEVIHFGDPAFDVGFLLTHLLSKAHHVRAQRAAFGEAAITFWNEYQSGLPLADWAAELEPHAAAHTLGCLLSRVAGRSPLEYLASDERAAQRTAVLALMSSPPRTIARLANDFLTALESTKTDSAT